MTCKNASHRLIKNEHQSKLPAGVTITGKIDCVDPSSINERFYDDGTYLKPCTENCLICDVSGCLKCDPNLALVDRGCKTASLVDYSLKQFYDPESTWTFNVRIILVDYPEVTDPVYQEFEKSMLNYQNKFKATLTETGEELQLNITKTGQKNQFLMRVNLPPIEQSKIKRGQKYKLTVQSYSESLNPNFVSRTRFYNLKQKLKEGFEVEILKVSNEPLKSTAGSIANFSKALGGSSTSADVAEGTGLVFMMLSGGKGGVIMKFSQYLKLIKRVKLIGEFLGISLQAFVEALSGGKEKKDYIKAVEEGEGNKRRTLEVSLTENQQLKIEEASNGSQNKLDRFVISVFFEGPFMIKTILYQISWLLKLIGVMILSNMKKSGKVVKWKLNYLKYQRKVHFMLMMSGVMDFYFFSTRILLHRRNSGLGWLVKTVCAVTLSLMTLDLMQMIMITLTVKHEPKSEEKTIAKKNSFAKEVGNTLNNNPIQSLSNQAKNNASIHEGTTQRLNPPEEKESNRNNNPSINPRRNQIMVHPSASILKRQKSKLFMKKKFDSKEKMTKTIFNKNQERKDDQNFKKQIEESNISPLARHLQRQKVNKGEIAPNEVRERQINQPNFNRNSDKHKTRATREPATIIKNEKEEVLRKKLFINHKKTIEYNSRDLSIEQFVKSILVDDPKAYESPLCLLNNCFNVIHLAIFQVLIPALPHAPEVLLALLILLEIISVLFTLIPLLFTFRFLPWVEISEKMLRFVFMAGFFAICFIISVTGDGRQQPFNQNLQSYGMLLLLVGVIANYLTTFIKVVMMVVKSAKTYLSKRKQKRKTDDEKLYQEQRGLIFYSEDDLGEEESKDVGFVIDLEGLDIEGLQRNQGLSFEEQLGNQNTKKLIQLLRRI